MNHVMFSINYELSQIFSSKIKTVVLNLDSVPEERWPHIVAPYKEEVYSIHLYVYLLYISYKNCQLCSRFAESSEHS